MCVLLDEDLLGIDDVGYTGLLYNTFISVWKTLAVLSSQVPVVVVLSGLMRVTW